MNTKSGPGGFEVLCFVFLAGLTWFFGDGVGFDDWIQAEWAANGLLRSIFGSSVPTSKDIAVVRIIVLLGLGSGLWSWLFWRTRKKVQTNNKGASRSTGGTNWGRSTIFLGVLTTLATAGSALGNRMTWAWIARGAEGTESGVSERQTPFPALEDDYFRYQWDAWVGLAGDSPYALAPAEPNPRVEQLVGMEPAESLRKMVSFPEFRSPYPPGAQWIFQGTEHLNRAVTRILGPSDWGDQGTEHTSRFLMILGSASALAIWAALRWVTGDGALSSMVVMHPLIQYEWVHTGHFDGWMIAGLLVALGIYRSIGVPSFRPGQVIAEPRRVILLLHFCGLAIGVASLIKWTVAITLPLFLIHFIFVRAKDAPSPPPARQSRKKWGQTPPLPLLALIAGFALPWGAWMGTDPHFPQQLQLLSSALAEFSQVWEMNSGLVRWIREALESIPALMPPFHSESLLTTAPRIAVTCVYLLIVLWILIRVARRTLALESSVAYLLWTLVLLSPVSNPWYFAWSIPFFALAPAQSRGLLWISLSVTILPLSLTFWAPSLQVEQSFIPYWNSEHIVLWIALCAAWGSESTFSDPHAAILP